MKGWSSLTLSLKILSVVLLLWTAMTVMVLITMPEREIAFYGLLLTGTPGIIVVTILDIISPILFLYAAWNKLQWGAKFGMLYNGIFILNIIIAWFMFSENFGNAIYFPLIASSIFFLVIYKERNYFT